MDELEKMLEYISAHGVGTVVLAIGICIGGYFVIKLGNLGLDHLREKIKTKKHDEMTDHRMEVGKTVQDLLREFVSRTKACRAYVFEFHNGTVSVGGLPYTKTSCVYESLGHGIESEALSRQNMPLQLYSAIYYSLKKYPFIVLDVNNRDENMDSQLGYETLVKRGVSVTVRVKITDLSGRMIGFVGVDYSDPVEDSTLQHAIDVMQEAAGNIGPLLSVKK